ncbi:MFS transporter [Patescibacteria group bacterium]|nr:MFS transporter [Patescibacteria group bacterium]
MRFHLVEDYKKLGFSSGLISLWSGKLLLDFGTNIFGLFLPIVLYQQFGNFDALIIWYIAISLGYFLLAPLGGNIINKIGLKASLLIGVFLRIPYFYGWYRFEEDPIFWMWVTAICLVLLRMTFWLPFQTDSAKFSSKRNRGKQFGVIFSLASLFSIIAPVIGGFLMESWGFALLSFVSMLVCILSIIPFWFLPHTKENMSWTYWETIKYFFHPFNRRMVTAYMSDGAVGTINTVFWPLFIFSVLDDRYQSVGLITGGVLLLGVVLRLFIGNLLDKFHKVRMVRWGTFLNSSAWLIKVLAASTVQVFLVSIYHTLALIVLRTSLDTLVYEKAADRGHYIDEYTLIREMAMHLGKVIVLCVVAGLLLIFPLQATFVLAAFAALFITLLQ